MADTSASDTSPADVSTLISALGTLIGYLGAEASTDDLFERLLWPQRYFHAQWSWHLIPGALFMPMGGPLHRGAIEALDKIREHGLFGGDRRGKMLGTVFYRDSHLVYNSLDVGPGSLQKKDARNMLWSRVSLALARTENPHLLRRRDKPLSDSPARTRLAVNIFTLTVAPEEESPSRVKPVTEDRAVLGPTLLVILWSELTGLVTAFVVFGVWQSMFGFLWVAPVVAKLVAALCSMEREPLLAAESGSGKERPMACIQVETKGLDLLVMRGELQLLRQFSTHFGHPVRCRWREIVLMALIVAFGLNFFVGLTLSVLIMPLNIQYVWLGYQLYATFAMFVYRYADGNEWMATETHIARKLEETARDGRAVAYFGSRRGLTLKVELDRTMVASTRQGDALVRRLQAEMQQ